VNISLTNFKRLIRLAKIDIKDIAQCVAAWGLPTDIFTEIGWCGGAVFQLLSADNTKARFIYIGGRIRMGQPELINYQVEEPPVTRPEVAVDTLKRFCPVSLLWVDAPQELSLMALNMEVLKGDKK
jgi:hypothetical protein